MRASLILLLTFSFFGLILWTTLSGASLVFGVLLLLLFVILTIGYADTAILFFLGAREVRSSDEPMFFEASSQQAYKLAVPLPKLYVYNGSLERAFVLQDRKAISIVLNRSLLGHARPEELSAICFGLLLQVKKGMANKRTKIMFLLGLKSWIIHALVSLLARLVPIKEVRLAFGWCINYLLYPWLNFLFRIALGEGYFRRLRNLLKEYPSESELIDNLGLKLRQSIELYSLPSKKFIELASSNRSGHFQNILGLELLPHEWDYFSLHQDISSAKEA